jgi:hypothetical protein
METMTALFNAWENTIETYKDTPNVEIEIRLGKVNRGKFDTNVGQQTFEKVLRRLRKFDEWESANESQSTVYYDTAASKRVVMNDVTDEMESCVIKKRLMVNDQVLSGFPVDVRLGISSEVHTTAMMTQMRTLHGSRSVSGILLCARVCRLTFLR